jgi:DNA (cytosine-5)-methyltransferase 1
MSTIVSSSVELMTTKVVFTHKANSQRLVEFFAGIGLVRFALERCGWSTVFANDISRDKFEIYRQNFDSSTFLLKDVREVRADEVPEAELATACFPCTDISLAGERGGLRAKESGTFWSFVRILAAKRRPPPLVLIENVEGLLTSNGGRDFRAVLIALNKLGYACDPLILDASLFLPQSRRRVLIVAARRDLVEDRSIWRPSESWVRPPALLRVLEENNDLDLFIREVGATPPRRKTQLADMIEEIPEDSARWWEPRRVTKLLNQMDPSHRLQVERAMGLPKATCLTVYRRTRANRSRAEVRADGTAGCLRTARGGSSRQILIAVSGRVPRVRFMTPREYARLQGLPDTFKLDAPEGKALFGLGDAVCVPVVEWVAKNHLAPLLSSLRDKAYARSATGPSPYKLAPVSSPA